jgi:deazaflavin-dependent oxidoreductase (nitroreductase family)
MLTTTGAKSGRSRTVPVLGIPTEGEIAIIASNFGQYRHPAWYHNLRAHPDAEVVVDGSRRRVRAVEADGERRSAIWQEGLRATPASVSTSDALRTGVSRCLSSPPSELPNSRR